jgi:hypothetical protein
MESDGIRPTVGVGDCADVTDAQNCIDRVKSKSKYPGQNESDGQTPTAATSLI